MSIDQSKYVVITSGVGGGTTVPQRELMGRLFTDSNLMPPGEYREFTSAASVGNYFGFESLEYLRAAFYFRFISKKITRAQKISFARWVNVAVAPRVYGSVASYLLVNFTSVSGGSFNITMGAFSTEITGVDLSAATSLADVASAVQTAIRAYTAGGTLFTGATVAYDATRKSFNLVGGVAGDADINITAGTTGTDIASRLGWLVGAILADGSDIESVTACLTNSDQASTNFGSFLFIPALTDDEVEQVADWNAGKNVKYMNCVRVSRADVADYAALLELKDGTGVTLSAVAGEYPEMCPMIVFASTDYNRQDAVQNFMYQQFDLTPSVTTDEEAEQLDALRINYYGQTQRAGAPISFYQNGLLMGGPTSPSDMNVYANEIWLKDRAEAALLNLLLALSRISANTQGRSQIMATLQGVVEAALRNGVISVGKPLNDTQKLYIGEITGDPNAWQQVQNIGYWLDVVMVGTTVDSTTTWKATYTLVYSKDDVVRKVEGTHVLI